MKNVFVVDTNKQPLNTVHPGEARLLLTRGKAAVLKRYPFTIILSVTIDDPIVAELRIKIDPGSKTTGIAIMNDATGEVVFCLGTVPDVGKNYCQKLQRADGYGYSQRNA